jgi:hypothetical protein
MIRTPRIVLTLVLLGAGGLWLPDPALPQDAGQTGEEPSQAAEQRPVNRPTQPRIPSEGAGSEAAEIPELPTGSVEVTILELAAPSRYVELARRFQTALDDQQEWAESYIRDHRQPDQPLPWHPNFRLTEQEYAELRSLAGEIRLRPKGRATVEITREAQIVTFDAPEALGSLNDISLDLAQRKVTTPFGDCADFEPARAGGPSSSTEPWNGVTCQRTQGDPQTQGRIVAFSLGRYEEDNALFLSYEGKKVENGAFVDRADVYLSVP